MTKEQAEKKVRVLEAEMHGAIANVFSMDSVKFWYAFVATSRNETFPAWPNTPADDEANRAKWHRLSEARKNASRRHMEIRTELRKLRRIAGMDTVI